MKLIRKNPLVLKGMSLFLVLTLLGEIFYPTYANALTSGPASPEFTSFEPVATTDMVDPFTGEFTYNLPVLQIPGADGGGYAMSLSYHSGVTPEEEASWVGYGWTLNAGAINRGKVGYPDEFENVSVRKFNKMVPNWTISAVENINIEIVSQDEAQRRKDQKGASQNDKVVGKSVMYENSESANSIPGFGGGGSGGVNLGYSQSLRYNNYSGVLKTYGMSVGFKGMASLNMNFAGGGATFGYSVNPLAIVKSYLNAKVHNLDERMEKADCKTESKLMKRNERRQRRNSSSANRVLNSYMSNRFFSTNFHSNQNLQYPGLSMAKTYGKSWNFTGTFGVEAWMIGLDLGYSGNANVNINEPETELKVNGYMHTPFWSEMNDYDDMNNNVSGDYYIENETNFKKTTRSLGVPFGGADAFSVSGEGVGGGFRLHHTTIPHYYQTALTNKEIIQNLGIELAVGQTIAVGLNVGFGWHRTKVGNWKDKNTGNLEKGEYRRAAAGSETFFQFMNDPATTVQYFPDGLRSMKFENNNKKIGDDDFNTDFFWDSNANEPKADFKKGASSYIEYRLNGTLDRLDKMIESAEINLESDPNIIREVKITKPNGSKYIYGVSVMSKNEKNLSVGLQESGSQLARDFTSQQRVAMSHIEPVTVMNNYIKSGSAQITDNMVVVGEETANSYANGYLLTQIVTPDYIDVNDNGPDDRDFGGWTKFTYRKKYKGQNLYHHRAPYTGVYYNRGRMTHNYDQTGQFSDGEKEVAYLKTVETKTHIACFVTNSTTASEFEDIAIRLGLTPEEKTKFLSYLNGSGDARFDGLDAANPSANGVDLAAQGEKGTRQLDKLERIVLFAKNRITVPVTTTHFDYSYELCKGIPNSVNAGVQNANQLSGKLTLKKVWTDTEGLSKARIAPYKFEYNYPNTNEISSTVLARYGNLFSPYQNLNENPDYKLGYLDSWGNYQDLTKSTLQRKYLRDWTYQGELSENYDPAAWALKKILLPSGGRIFIQYEQKDYTHVQDKAAMTMLSIDDNNLNENGYKYDENKYYINLKDVGVDPQDPLAVRDYYIKLAQEYFSNVTAADLQYSSMEIFDDGDGGSSHKSKQNMLFFRFLVNYTDNVTNFGVGKSDDFVEGYCPVNRIGIENDSRIFFRLGGESKEQKYLTPRRIAYEQSKTMANLALDVNDRLDLVAGQDVIDNRVLERAYDGQASNKYTEELKEVKQYLLKSSNNNNPERLGLRTKVAESVLLMNVPSKANLCAYFNPAMSHFKLIVPEVKRGGGVRVKRLLMYNPGIENGEASLYGSEYIYKTKEGKSSGVATSEPSHYENSLVDILPKYKQSTWNKLLAGRDKSWAEGPLGGHLLPAPSVGHSRVVIKNIHSGRSSAGFVINEYATCKKFPSITVEQTELHNDKNNNITNYYKKAKFSIPLGLFNYSQDMAWLLQGYLFTIDDRHGLLESSYTYNGNYENYLLNPSSASIYASIQNTYSAAAVDVISGEVANGELVLKRAAKNLGLEEDVAMHAGQVEDRTFDFAVELDLNFLLQWPPVMTFGFGLNLSYSETELNQHVTSRVVRRTSKLTKSVSYADGITTTTEHLAYNDQDGSPIISRVTSAYDAAGQNNRQHNQGKDNVYYSMNLPAPWVYATMGKKTIDPNNLNLLNASMGSISTHMENPMDQFENDNQWLPYSEPIEGIVSATAIEFRKNRFDDQISDFAFGQATSTSMVGVKEAFGVYNPDVDVNDLAKMNAFYYPVASYAYVGDRSSANNAQDGRVYKDGIIENFSFFKWGQSGEGQNENLEAVNPKWLSPSFVTKFSPNGQALEEVNRMGIPSSVHFGYNAILPTITGANAEYETILFDDYENAVPGNPIGSVESKGHTGKKSIVFSANNGGVISEQSLVLTQRLIDKGGRFKIWVRATDPGSADPLLAEAMDGNPKLNIGGNAIPLTQIAKVGEWILLRCDINDWGTLNSGDTFELKMEYDNNGYQLLIDDVCFHPLEAGVSMTVYNPNDLRVVAQMDDQHFATIYEYDTKGQLVRTIIETERGRKTVKEQQMNQPKELRDE